MALQDEIEAQAESPDFSGVVAVSRDGQRIVELARGYGGPRHGLGFFLRADRETVMLEGSDAGVSCRTVFDRPSGLMYTVISNTSSGAWPLVKYLDERLPTLAS